MWQHLSLILSEVVGETWLAGDPARCWIGWPGDYYQHIKAVASVHSLDTESMFPDCILVVLLQKVEWFKQAWWQEVQLWQWLGPGCSWSQAVKIVAEFFGLSWVNTLKEMLDIGDLEKCGQEVHTCKKDTSMLPMFTGTFGTMTSLFTSISPRSLFCRRFQ